MYDLISYICIDILQKLDQMFNVIFRDSSINMIQGSRAEATIPFVPPLEWRARLLSFTKSTQTKHLLVGHFYRSLNSNLVLSIINKII